MTELRRLRLLHTLKIDTVAKAMEIDPSMLSLLECGKRTPSLLLAKRLAAFYELSVEDVFPK